MKKKTMLISKKPLNFKKAGYFKKYSWPIQKLGFAHNR